MDILVALFLGMAGMPVACFAIARSTASRPTVVVAGVVGSIAAGVFVLIAVWLGCYLHGVAHFSVMGPSAADAWWVDDLMLACGGTAVVLGMSWTAHRARRTTGSASSTIGSAP